MNTNRVVARSTTLLPNIPGLASILTLLFAPRAEFRTNATRTRLTGAICGLGFDRERNCQSFYPEHDMEIAFDTEIYLNVSSYEFLFTLEVLIIVFFFFQGCAAHQQIEILVQFRVGANFVQLGREFGAIERSHAGGEPKATANAV